jgi:hypothetical protein
MLTLLLIAINGAVAARVSAQGTITIHVRAPTAMPHDGLTDVLIDVTSIGGPDNAPVTVTVYYAVLINKTEFDGWWRTATGRWSGQVRVLPNKETTKTYLARIPDESYAEELFHNTLIVFYVEVTTKGGQVFLTSREQDRWDPRILDDKTSILLTDIRPPEISYVSISPSEVVYSNQNLTILAGVADELGGSGVMEVNVTFIFDESNFTTPMKNVGRALYQATIPAQRAGSYVSFHIEACDLAGNRIQRGPFGPYLIRSASEVGSGSLYVTFLGGAIAVAAFIVVFRLRTRTSSLQRIIKASLAFLVVVLLGRMTYWLVLWRQLLATALVSVVVVAVALLSFDRAASFRFCHTFRSVFVRLIIDLRVKSLQHPPLLVILIGYSLGLVGVAVYLIARPAGWILGIFPMYAFMFVTLGTVAEFVWLALKRREIGQQT